MIGALPSRNFVVSSNEMFIFRRYYSSEERKYLKISFQGRNISKHDQAIALKNGLQLAWAFNRTLILPKFNHEKGYTHFLDIFGYCISILDEMVEVSYREHMFLENHLVPEKVRTRSTEVLHISRSTRAKKVLTDFSDLFKELSPF